MKKLVIFAILANLISCYTYINDELPRIRPLKKKIKLDMISFRVTGVDDTKKSNDFSQLIKERFEKTGLFDKVNVVDGTGNADKHHLEIHLKELGVFEKNYMTSLSTAITAGTVFVTYAKQPIFGILGLMIPIYRTNKYSMLVDYYIDGKLKRYDRFNQSSTKLYGPIPALYSLKNGDSVENPEMEVISNMADNAVFYLNELNYTEASTK